MNPITVSINPTYLCNFRCSFCYLTSKQLADKRKIELSALDHLLTEVNDNTIIKHIDLYGGEIGLLPSSYFYEMKKVIKKHFNGPINIVSNLHRVPDFFMDGDTVLSVSYDFECREHNERVFANMATVQKDIHVLILASKCIIQQDVDHMIMLLNVLTNVKTVEIKPYSTNQANQQDVSHKDFEEFIKKWIVSPIKKNFVLINEEKIQASLNRYYNAFSDDHIYITPQGQFAVLDFDPNDKEHFRIMPTFKHYIQWCEEEKKRVFSNLFCSKCEFLGHCLTEHLRNVKSLNNSCNGYKFLLQWYQNERMENKTRNLP